MLTHEAFGRLRLADFVAKSRIAKLENWKFDERTWVGEASGFSEWLRPASRPTVLESLSIDLAKLPEKVVQQMLEQLDLPLRRGMSRGALDKVFGRPAETHVFATDRKTFDYRVRKPHGYDVSCTVLNDGGLTYLVVAPRKARK